MTTLFMFLLLMLAGRQLGAEDFGRFTFAWRSLSSSIRSWILGIYHYLVREMRATAGRAIGSFRTR